MNFEVRNLPRLRLENLPGASVHIAQETFLPCKLRVLCQVGGGLEADAAGVSGSRHERHLLGQRGVGHLVLNGARDAIGGLPGGQTALGKVDVTAQCPFARLRLAGVSVKVIGEESLGGFDGFAPCFRPSTDPSAGAGHWRSSPCP